MNACLNLLKRERKPALWLAVALALVGLVYLFQSVTSAPPRQWTTPPGNVTYLADDTADGGRVEIMLGTTRDYGYRIGDIVPVRITVIGDGGIRMNFEELTHEIIALDGSADFMMEAPPSISHYTADGKQVWQVDLYLHCFKKVDSIDFSTSFYFSDHTLKNGEPDWVPYSTPTVSISTANTAPANAQSFLPGDQSQRQVPQHPLGWVLLFVAALATGVVPFMVARRLWRRYRKERTLAANQVAWRVFDDTFKRAGSRWQLGDYQAIGSAVRRYFEIESLTRSEIAVALADHPLKDNLVEVLRKIDLQLYGKPADEGRPGLRFDLERLIPRPGKD